MSFPKSVADEALLRCGRYCCICHKFCGTKIQLHHIKRKADGGEDILDNCIPLCLDCHSDMGKIDPKHPIGKQYTENELRLHRDNWFNRNMHPSSLLNNKVDKQDKELFQKICDLFSPNVCEYLYEHNFSGTHPEDTFKELDKFFQQHDPFSRFINEDIENLRYILEKSWLEFLGIRASKTFHQMIAGEGYYVTNLWLLNRWRSEDEFNKLSTEFEKDAELINDSALNVWVIFNEFIQKTRSILS